MITEQTKSNFDAIVWSRPSAANPRSLRILTALIALATLAACVHPTPYKAAVNDSRDGYTTQQLESNRFRISFKGNSETTRQTVDSYVLYRNAEVTVQSSQTL